jgi:molybdopterin synthase catalytic subunit
MIPPRDRDWVEITEAPLDLAAVVRHLDDPACGGRVIFSGNVRPSEDGREISGLQYEQYSPMALSQMRRLAEEIHDRWPVGRLALVHRVGFIAVGDSSVLIGAASAHRAEAFEAAQFAIARIKEIVPIWKGEGHGPGG